MPDCPVCGEHAHGAIRTHEASRYQMPEMYLCDHRGRLYLHFIDPYDGYKQSVLNNGLES